MKYEVRHDNVYDELVERGYLDQCTFEDDLKDLLASQKVPFYVGFDATADSLTLGHWVQIMVMMRMQAHGHIPIALLGGGTTMIGDPSARSDMRKMMTKETIDSNANKFNNQISKFINFDGENGYIDNNANWLLDLNFLEFMRDIGVHFNVNEMLKKDAYKNRLDKGLTFFEFSYMLMQSYDYLILNRKYGCKIQLGGSDQWSNIIGGADLVKRYEDEQVYAMTFKLLTRADGVKMGKSMKGAIWLDEQKTSAYQLYQYMRNSDDRDVSKFLKLLTFVPLDEIKELTKYNDQRINKAKEVLAYEVVKLIHGENKANEALETSKALFNKGSIDENMPSTEIDYKTFEENKGILNMLTYIGITKSNGEARRLIKQNGISINDEKLSDFTYELKEEDFNDGLIIQKGKKVFHRVILK